eukprot:m.122067 g.122067  ORF g.122067 m.122067 type:complete len:454 (-) comp13407_c0_seq1:296-1657(-)
MCAAAEVERVAKAAPHTQTVSPCDEGLVVALTLKDGSHVGGVVRQVMKKWVKLLSLETMVIRIVRLEDISLCARGPQYSGSTGAPPPRKHARDSGHRARDVSPAQATILEKPTPVGKTGWAPLTSKSVLSDNTGSSWAYTGEFWCKYPVFARNGNEGFLPHRVFREGHHWYYNDQRGFEKAAMIPHVEGGDNNLPPTGPGWVCCASNCPLDIEFDTWYQFEKELEALDPVQPTIIPIPTPIGQEEWAPLSGECVLSMTDQTGRSSTLKYWGKFRNGRPVFQRDAVQGSSGYKIWREGAYWYMNKHRMRRPTALKWEKMFQCRHLTSGNPNLPPTGQGWAACSGVRFACTPGPTSIHTAIHPNFQETLQRITKTPVVWSPQTHVRCPRLARVTVITMLLCFRRVSLGKCWWLFGNISDKGNTVATRGAFSLDVLFIILESMRVKDLMPAEIGHL